MSSIPRNLPRFLPTLTEVVQPEELTKMVEPEVLDLEGTVLSVMQRMEPMIERRLREETDALLRNMVAEQLPVLNSRLRQELETIVRQAVSEAMTSRSSQHKLK